jgi:dTDP-glucose pyrophosphorylase
MQDPDTNRTNYQMSCQYRRAGKTLQERDGDKWKNVGTFESINAAKRAVRERGLKVYAA